MDSNHYKKENIFKDKNIAERYEKFVVGGLEEVLSKFGGVFKKIIAKILFPNYTQSKNSSPRNIWIIEFGIGSGKFTIPFIKSLLESGLSLKVNLFGIDNSKYMLKKLKKNLRKSCLNSYFKRKLIINADINKFSWQQRFSNFINSAKENEIKIFIFAQIWHYIENPKEFFNNIKDILKKPNTYILHFEPIYYFKLLDGNFTFSEYSLKFEDEKEKTHYLFWLYYYSLRDEYHPYSCQKITATREDYIYELYKKEGFLELKNEIAEWEKNFGKRI